MSLAYIISAHRLPDQLTRMVGALDPTSAVLIHVDRKTDEATYRRMVDGLAGRENVRWLPRHTCHWGGFGHVAASLEGLSAIVEEPIDCDHAIRLAGQDYPIKSNRHIRDFLTARRGTSFIEHFELPAPDRWPRVGRGGLDRVEPIWFQAFGRQRRLPARRRLPEGLAPFGGSAYWCLARAALEHLHDLTGDRPELVRFFRRCRVPDELFFQTLLANSALRDTLADDSLSYYRFDPSGSRGAVLTEADLPELEGSTETALFARKFDVGVDARVLDRLDQLNAR